MMYKQILSFIFIFTLNFSICLKAVEGGERIGIDKPDIPVFTMPQEDHHQAISAFSSSLLKSTERPFQLTDSIITYHDYSETDSTLHHKIRYQYNDQNLLTHIGYYRLNEETETWEAYKRFNYSFNESSLQSEFLQETVNEYSGLWEHEIKREYHYTSGMKVESVSEFQWNTTTSDWAGVWKYHYDYDAQINLILKTAFEWNIAHSDWELATKQEMSYNSQNIRTITVSYYRDKEQHLWIGDQKMEYFYDDQFRPIRQINFFWDAEQRSWVKSLKKEFAYNGSGYQASWEAYRWDRNYKEWVEWWKVENMRDSHNNTVKWTDYQWSIQEQKWVEGWKVESSYNTYNELTSETTSVWSPEVNDFDGIYQLEYHYNNDFSVKTVNDYSWDEALDRWTLSQKRFHHFSAPELIPLTFIILDNAGLPVNNARISIDGQFYEEGVYHFPAMNKGELSVVITAEGYTAESFALTISESALLHTVILGVSTNLEFMDDLHDLKVFPNPARNVIVVESSEEIQLIRLFSINGSLVREVVPLTRSWNLSVEDLPPGIYLIQAKTGRGIDHVKVIIERH